MEFSGLQHFDKGETMKGTGMLLRTKEQQLAWPHISLYPSSYLLGLFLFIFQLSQMDNQKVRKSIYQNLCIGGSVPRTWYDRSLYLVDRVQEALDPATPHG